MKKIDYYKAPDNDIFEEIKANSIKIWKTYDNTFGYADEKINQIKDIKNIEDNCYFMVSMFDSNNQHKLKLISGTKTREWIELLFNTINYYL